MELQSYQDKQGMYTLVCNSVVFSGENFKYSTTHFQFTAFNGFFRRRGAAPRIVPYRDHIYMMDKKGKKGTL